ncbi:PQQ-binding-like beta-propeller repeat protein [Haloferax sp. S1W]|uniref:outer membrane protein assembly factor BamB family protein n=1 Tax=Haloferax sp. S1W TaxID=3377110 RepID=UPI0037C96E80
MVSRRAFLATLLSGTAGCTGLVPSSSTTTDEPPTTRRTQSPTETTKSTETTTTPEDTTGTPEDAAATQCGAQWDPTVEWSVNTKLRVFQPAVADGVVYAGSHNQLLYAVDAATGTVLWKTHANVAFGASPTVSGQTLTFGGYSRIARYDTTTGDRVWSFTPPGDRASLSEQHATDGETVYVGASQRPTPQTDPEPTYDRVYALDLTEGTTLWQTSIGGDDRDAWAVPEAVTAALGRVYVATEQGELVVLDAADGSIRWRRRFGESRDRADRPVVFDGILYQSVGDMTYALDATTGESLWYDSGDYPPAVTEGATYFAHDSTVEAHSPADGSVWWCARFPCDGVGGTPAVSDGVVYVPVGCHESNAAVYALDATDGCRLGSFEVESDDVTTPVVGDESVYVGGLSGSAKLWSLSAAAVRDSS